jgi:hypothetical protein
MQAELAETVQQTVTHASNVKKSVTGLAIVLMAAVEEELNVVTDEGVAHVVEAHLPTWEEEDAEIEVTVAVGTTVALKSNERVFASFASKKAILRGTAPK